MRSFRFRRRHPRSRGFTLIEMMIVVVIIGVLAAIAFPIYRGTVLKTDRADARTSLLTWQATLERCYSQYFYYTNATPTASQPDCPSPPASGTGTLSTQGLYSITATRTASTYTLNAVPVAGKITESDAKCTRLSLDNTGRKTSGGTGTAAYCWASN